MVDGKLVGAEFFWRDSYKHEVDVVIADEKDSLNYM